MCALGFRNSEISDMGLILAWRNSDSVRKFSRNSGLITEREHAEWFQQRLSILDSNPFWIVNENDLEIGFVRFDSFQNSSYQISILVDPSLQGQGYGSRILRESLKKLVVLHYVSRIEAHVHKDNFASTKLFLACGFKKIKTVGQFIHFQKL
jgi:RimJ/RimL family protein N-acetyltransferase